MKQTLPFLFLFVLLSCGSPESKNSDTAVSGNPIEFFGNTQGTTFSVIINDDIDISMEEIESTLKDFDLALSTYIPESFISELNNGPAGAIELKDPYGYFERCFSKSEEVYQITNGAFDPAVYPLVEGWGFMSDISENTPDSAKVDSLRSLLGMTRHFGRVEIIAEDTMLRNDIVKFTPGAKLDFNAVAQGLAVDVIAEMIEAKGGKNYFVEIGGEIRVKGKNKDGVFWRIGIDKPIDDSNEENRELQEIIQIENRSVATSGSYRKFYIKNGEKYSHTLDPKTGYPVKHNLLSATVVADDCATADAFATTFMVLGTEKTKKFLAEHDSLNLEAYLIFTNDKDRLETYYTSGFSEMITE